MMIKREYVPGKILTMLSQGMFTSEPPTMKIYFNKGDEKAVFERSGFCPYALHEAE
jgi:hypothetical protein